MSPGGETVRAHMQMMAEQATGNRTRAPWQNLGSRRREVGEGRRRLGLCHLQIRYGPCRFVNTDMKYSCK